MQTSSRDNRTIIEDLESVSAEMLRRKAPICFLVNKLRTCCIRTKKVLVLIPPPVEPGEAPINIRMMSVKSPALVNSPMG